MQILLMKFIIRVSYAFARPFRSILLLNKNKKKKKHISPKKRINFQLYKLLFLLSECRQKNIILKLILGILFLSGKLFLRIIRILKRRVLVIKYKSVTCIRKMAKEILIFLRKNNYFDLFVICMVVFVKTNNRIYFYEINDVKEYCTKLKCKYKVVEESKKRSICIPMFFELQEEKIEEYLSPQIYIAEIDEAEIIGANSFILSHNKCLYDPIRHDKEKRYDVRFSSLKKMMNNLVIIEAQKDNRRIEEAIFMLGFASYNYYHLTIEILSRLAYIDQFEEYRSLPIIVDKIVMKIPQYKQVLERINKYQHPVIEISEDEIYTIHRLIYPSANVWMPINVKSRELIQTNDFMIAPSALHNIRNGMLMSNDVKPYKNIFISRKNTKAIRLQNEIQVRELFEKKGFEIIYTEGMSLEEQIKCFQEAKCIVATSGAALTNIVYCQPGTVIACIIPEEYKFYMYSTIAYLLGLKPVFLNARVTMRTLYTASDIFEIELKYCLRFIEEYCSKY